MTTAETLGVEVNSEYAEQAENTADTVVRASVFDLDLARDLPWRSSGDLLVVGNPPWVTSAQLGRLGSINLPKKSNVKGLPGFDAMTGASNFDIAEYILLKLMVELAGERPTIALLVKTQVARNVLLHASRFGMPYSKFEIRRFDAKSWFGASVDACLFSMEHSEAPEYGCSVYDDLGSSRSQRRIGVVDSQLVADLELYQSTASADGRSPLEWRSGVKHDASKVMELSNEQVDAIGLEADYVFPMLKCSDLFRGRHCPSKQMVVPQHHFGEDTQHLEATAPTLWAYLNKNSSALDDRRSSIYRNQPRFTVFGLGEYTFKPYRIAISGLHKEVRFALLGPVDGKPIVVDDASYAISFDDPLDAAMTHAILSSQPAANLLDSLIFWDAKRPVNKKLLQRLDLLELASCSEPSDLEQAAQEAANKLGVTASDWQAVLDRLVREWTLGLSDSDARNGVNQQALF